MRKGLAVTLIAALIFTTGHWASIEAAPNFLQSLNPPSSLGAVTDSFKLTTTAPSKLVILIQDLHVHYGVQKNIAGILAFLEKKQPFALAVEGASGPIDNSVMARFPDQTIKEQAADYLVREGELNGAEYYAIVRGLPNKLIGVEDPRYYNLHRDLFRTTLEKRSRLIPMLRGIQVDLQALRSTVYSKPLKKLQAKQDAFQAGKLDAQKYFAYLASEAKALGMEIQLPDLSQVKDIERLWQEAESLAFMLKMEKAQQPLEKDLVQVEHDLNFLIKVGNLQATESEIRSFGPRINQFIVLCHALLQSSGVETFDEASIRELISSSIDYYALALARNQPMVENTLALLNPRDRETASSREGQDVTPQRSGDLALSRDVVVLVAGGFHTRQITELLRQKNVAFAVITPNVDDSDTAYHDLYVKRLSGQLLTEREVLAAAPKWPATSTQLAAKSSGQSTTLGFAGIATVGLFLAAALSAGAHGVPLDQYLPHFVQILEPIKQMPSVSEWIKGIPALLAASVASTVIAGGFQFPRSKNKEVEIRTFEEASFAYDLFVAAIGDSQNGIAEGDTDGIEFVKGMEINPAPMKHEKAILLGPNSRSVVLGLGSRHQKGSRDFDVIGAFTPTRLRLSADKQSVILHTPQNETITIHKRLGFGQPVRITYLVPKETSNHSETASRISPKLVGVIGGAMVIPGLAWLAWIYFSGVFLAWLTLIPVGLIVIGGIFIVISAVLLVSQRSPVVVTDKKEDVKPVDVVKTPQDLLRSLGLPTELFVAGMEIIDGLKGYPLHMSKERHQEDNKPIVTLKIMLADSRIGFELAQLRGKPVQWSIEGIAPAPEPLKIGLPVMTREDYLKETRAAIAKAKDILRRRADQVANDMVERHDELKGAKADGAKKAIVNFILGLPAKFSKEQHVEALANQMHASWSKAEKILDEAKQHFEAAPPSEGGALKYLSVRDELDETNLKALRDRQPAFKAIAVQHGNDSVIEDIPVKVILASLPQGVMAYQFKASADTLIVVLNDSFHQEEVLYHEVREAHWMEKGYDRHQAHVLASAEQVLKFSHAGQPTPYHQWQVDNMDSDRLLALINEREQEAGRLWHHDLIRQAGLDLPAIQAYEHMLYVRMRERWVALGERKLIAPFQRPELQSGWDLFARQFGIGPNMISTTQLAELEQRDSADAIESKMRTAAPPGEKLPDDTGSLIRKTSIPKLQPAFTRADKAAFIGSIGLMVGGLLGMIYSSSPWIFVLMFLLGTLPIFLSKFKINANYRKMKTFQLLISLDSSDPYQRYRAIRAMLDTGRGPLIAEKLIEMLKSDSDPKVLQAAIHAVRKLKLTEAAEPLLGLIDRGIEIRTQLWPYVADPTMEALLMVSNPSVLKRLAQRIEEEMDLGLHNLTADSPVFERVLTIYIRIATRKMNSADTEHMQNQFRILMQEIKNPDAQEAIRVATQEIPTSPTFHGYDIEPVKKKTTAGTLIRFVREKRAESPDGQLPGDAGISLGELAIGMGGLGLTGFGVSVLFFGMAPALGVVGGILATAAGLGILLFLAARISQDKPFKISPKGFSGSNSSSVVSPMPRLTREPVDLPLYGHTELAESTDLPDELGPGGAGIITVGGFQVLLTLSAVFFLWQAYNGLHTEWLVALTRGIAGLIDLVRADSTEERKVRVVDAFLSPVIFYSLACGLSQGQPGLGLKGALLSFFLAFLIKIRIQIKNNPARYTRQDLANLDVTSPRVTVADLYPSDIPYVEVSRDRSSEPGKLPIQEDSVKALQVRIDKLTQLLPSLKPKDRIRAERTIESLKKIQRRSHILIQGKIIDLTLSMADDLERSLRNKIQPVGNLSTGQPSVEPSEDRSSLTAGELLDHMRPWQVVKGWGGIAFNVLRYPFIKQHLQAELNESNDTVNLILAANGQEPIKIQAYQAPINKMLWNFGDADKKNRVVRINPLLPSGMKLRAAIHEALHVLHRDWSETQVIATTERYMEARKAQLAVLPQTVSGAARVISSIKSRARIGDLPSLIPLMLTELHLKPREAASISGTIDPYRQAILGSA